MVTFEVKYKVSFYILLFSAKILLVEIIYLSVFEMSAAFILSSLIVKKTSFGFLHLKSIMVIYLTVTCPSVFQRYFCIAVVHKNINFVE